MSVVMFSLTVTALQQPAMFGPSRTAVFSARAALFAMSVGDDSGYGRPAVEVANDPDSCYLFDTKEGRKYVCTDNPEELAWHMGLEVNDLQSVNNFYPRSGEHHPARQSRHSIPKDPHALNMAGGGASSTRLSKFDCEEDITVLFNLNPFVFV